MKMNTILIIDASPVFYRWGFSSSSFYARTHKVQANGLYNFEEYKDVFIFQVMEYISKQKSRFKSDEVVLAIDSKPYWREKIWTGYKFGRWGPESGGIDWYSIKKAQKEVIKLLDECCSFKVIDIKGAEADDVGFVLTEALSPTNNIILHTVDHDWSQNMLHENVKVWETKYSSKTKQCGYVQIDRCDIQELKDDHVIYGDKGDYVFPITAYSEFSKEFKEQYKVKIEDGSITPLKLWPKRHEFDLSFAEKFKDKYPELYAKNNLSAYKHPRFGKKTFEKKMAKEGFNVQDYLKTNKIFELNFKLNEILVLAEGIPKDIQEDILKEYYSCNTTRDIQGFNTFVTEYNCWNLMGKAGLY